MRELAPPGSSTLQLPAPLHRLEHGDLIGVLDVAADRDAHCDPRHFHSGALQLLRKVSRSGFPFNRGIGGHDHFIDITRVNTRDQIGDA